MLFSKKILSKVSNTVSALALCGVVFTSSSWAMDDERSAHLLLHSTPPSSQSVTLESSEHSQKFIPTYNLTDASALTFYSIGGPVFAVHFVKNRATIRDLKEQVAQMWNNKFGTDYSAHQICLGAGVDWFAETESNKRLYEDTDVLSREAIYRSYDRRMYIFIKGKHPTATEDNPLPLTVRSMDKNDFQIHFITRGDTIGYLKEQIATMRDEKLGTTTSASQIKLSRGPDWFAETDSDERVYKDTDVLSRDAIHRSKDRLIWMFIGSKDVGGKDIKVRKDINGVLYTFDIGEQSN